MPLTSGAFTAGQFWFLVRNFLRQGQAPPAQEIARVADIPVGGSLLFEYPARSPARVLVRVDEETFVAYEQQCTHLLCPVIPQAEQRQLHCPCHQGYFDLMTGRPLAGPPRRPLARVTLEVRDGSVYATGILCIVIIIVLQLWLFTATMNAYLGGDVAVLLPAALVSLVCLGLNAGLLRYLYGLEH